MEKKLQISDFQEETRIAYRFIIWFLNYVKAWN